MDYNFREIESKWQRAWKQTEAYRVSNDSGRPKYYVLDMFPYPSGSGLHVGHPLGYIASDIFARYKRLKGFEVLHPMGFDAFGLPAEQYALETGQHPAITTAENIRTFKAQLDRIGFSFDWSREVNTSDPSFYHWTQWIFLQLFDCWFNTASGKAERIQALCKIFEAEGNRNQPCPSGPGLSFGAKEWKQCSEKRRQEILMGYRLAYCGLGEVNWCEALGTVLANDEVINGLSERGGYPVVRKKLRQWYLRITAYADRLLEGLRSVNFSQAMKEMQTNWIGRSEGAEIRFPLRVTGGGPDREGLSLLVYTTRPDTIFGVDFMVIAPEHELASRLAAPGHEVSVKQYLDYVASRNERERMAEKAITGIDTGSVAINPFNGREVPVWISEYVLAGYGTGAIMGVPCGDERDHRFATHFGIPITNIIGSFYDGSKANPTNSAILEQSGFLDGMVMSAAVEVVIRELEKRGFGCRKVNYKMRDAAFSRQRYWGEPFPIVWEDGIARPLKESELPLKLPHVDQYRPGPEGEGPLANLESWTRLHLETNTMPGYAGSSWYFLRFMDPHDSKAFCSRKASDYWGQVDLYIGGTEHAVGHLLYSRMWTKFLFDLGYIGHDEPYRTLVNQGMIQGVSELAYRVIPGKYPLGDLIPPASGGDGEAPSHLPNPENVPVYFSADWLPEGKQDGFQLIHLPINMVANHVLDIPAHAAANPDACYITRSGYFSQGVWHSPEGGLPEFRTVPQVEKMSKSKYNVVNPDDIVDKYGADTFRLYEMFLGPIELSKPWDTQGIEGVHRFLKKLWRLCYSESGELPTKNGSPPPEALKILHKTIRKVGEDTEKLSFNTAVSQFMICVNELTAMSCRDPEVISSLLILLAPYAPHISEELWHALGNQGTILTAAYPDWEEKLLKEEHFLYPVAINGKTRTEMSFPADAEPGMIEKEVLAHPVVLKWLGEKKPKKVIIVPRRMVNVVL
ncbi:MAG TPA: class I tRNA ligase family protein [Chitinophagaceae bacterium]|nr:class I tRNA ligase family protein [Chitinophagaceae bacterium]